MKTHKKCGNNFVIKPNMFFWHDQYFSGLVCEHCNALFDNPEDSFLTVAIKATHPVIE